MASNPPSRRHWLRTALVAILALVVAAAASAALFLRLPWIRTEAVTFNSDGVTLAGTLALPRWRESPFPAAVVVQGSGTVSRWAYWSYARHLVPAGMAVLIYDKRGVGASAGTTPMSPVWKIEDIANCGQRFETLADDALAGVALLKSRKDIDGRKIGLAGISQAGWIMPLAASRSGDVAFIVSVSGPAVSCGMEDWYSQLTGEYRAYPKFQAPAPYAEGELSDDEIERKLHDYTGPPGFDPVPVVASLRIPSLWLLGGRDRSVPTARSVANLEQLIAAGAPVELRVYPDGDHALTRGGGSSAKEAGINRLFRRIDFWADAEDWLRRRGFLE